MPKCSRGKCICVFVVSPTHCKMQGTGINFLHFAETFGHWVTLTCRRHWENPIHGPVKHCNDIISTAVFIIPHTSFTSSTSCTSIMLPWPSKPNLSFTPRNDQLTIPLMSARAPPPWKLMSPVAYSHVVSALRLLLKAVAHVVPYQWTLEPRSVPLIMQMD